MRQKMFSGEARCRSSPMLFLIAAHTLPQAGSRNSGTMHVGRELSRMRPGQSDPGYDLR